MKKTKLLIVTSLVLVMMLCSFATDVQATEETVATPKETTVNTPVINGAGRYDEGAQIYRLQVGDTLTVPEPDATWGEGEFPLGSNNQGIVSIEGYTIKAEKTGVTRVTYQNTGYGSPYEIYVYTKIQDIDMLNEINVGLNKDIIPADYFRVSQEWNSIQGLSWNIRNTNSKNVEMTLTEITSAIDFNTDVILTKDSSAPDVLFMEFAHKGALPAKEARISFTVDTSLFGTGSAPALRLYKYDEQTKMCTVVGNPSVSYYNGGMEVTVSEGADLSAKYVFMHFWNYKDLPVGTTVKLVGTTEPAKAETTGAVKNDTLEKVTETTVVADNTPSSSVSANNFETAKKEKKPIKVLIPSKIAWEFPSWDIDNAVALNPYVEVSNTKFEKIKTASVKNGVFLDFAHSGKLPGKADVTLNVGTEKYGKGAKTLFLYYYNPQTDSYKYEGTASYNNGVAKFELSHCSTYVLVDSRFDIPASAPAVAGAPAPVVATGTLDNEPKAGEATLLPVAMLAIVSLGVCVVTKK